VAKLAPDTERLAGSVAPKSKRFKANLGKARFVHQKANVYTNTSINKYIYISTNITVTMHDNKDNVNDLPGSLEGWTDLHLIECFKLTKNKKLREMIAIELQKRLVVN